MKRIVVFGLGMVAGLLLACGLGGIGIPVAAQGGGAGAEGISNGDVNGDGQLGLSDAIYLLQHLFQGGPEPVLIECGEPPPPSRAKMRFLNDLVCGDTPFPSLLAFCSASATDSFDVNGLPTACLEFDVRPTCPARVNANTNECGSFAVCADINPVAGHVYDFVLTVDELGVPFLLYFDQFLDQSGACPAFPPPGTPPTGAFSDPCAAALAGAGAGAGALRSVAW